MALCATECMGVWRMSYRAYFFSTILDSGIELLSTKPSHQPFIADLKGKISGISD